MLPAFTRETGGSVKKKRAQVLIQKTESTEQHPLKLLG
jgi:hypothetical protein